MSEHSFENAPDMGRDFSDSQDSHEMPLEHDAEHWEPTEEIEHPSEKHAEMHYTPGGHMEQEVHEQIDQASRARITEAQQDQVHDLTDEKKLDFANDFEEARRNAFGWDPESRREYETFTEEQQIENELFERDKRFEHERDCDFER